MTSYRSGLSAQLGIAAETTPGMAVTVVRFYEFLDESLDYELTRLDSQGLRAGQAFKRVSRSSVSRYGVSGDITMEHADTGMGLWWQHCLGSQATTGVQIGTTGAYRQIHTPGSHDGMGLTIQVGRPEAETSTVKPFTYRGAKLGEWQFSISDGDLAQLKLTVDAWDEVTATALAATNYDNNGVFSFADASTFTIGGTVSTTAGLTSITGGSALSSVMKSLKLKGKTPMDTERYGLGNSGIKKNQIANDIPEITGSLEGEFGVQSEIYDLYRSNATTALQLDLAHGTAGTGQAYRLSLIMPAIKFTKPDLGVNGPDIVQLKPDFEVYDDGTNPPFQVVLVTGTSAI